ncbi:MAG: GTP-binding protein [Cyanobacteria bacterium P01_E01_bin.42]
MMSNQLEIPKRKLPVTIITGFLGSGKTTLLNHILQNNRDLKTAVLVNEFGDINIDSQLLVSVEQDMIELSNGCICCTINEGLVEAVYNILERDSPVDYLIIETTGVADPLPIVLTFIGYNFRNLTRLDSIIAVVDSETFTPDCFDSEAALQQVALSDIVLLNKTDLATEKKVKELEQYIQTIKNRARILHSQHGKVPLPFILDVELTQPDRYQGKSDREHHHHHHSHHLANDGFVSVSFQSDRPLDVGQFERVLTQMSTEIFRGKGILWFSDTPETRHIFQLSGGRYDLKSEDWQEKPKNQLVLIGRHIDPQEMYRQLEGCLQTPAAIKTGALT